MQSLYRTTAAASLFRHRRLPRRPRRGVATTTTLERYVEPFQSSQVTSTRRPRTSWLNSSLGVVGQRALAVGPHAGHDVPDRAGGHRHGDLVARGELLEVVERPAAVVDRVAGQQRAAARSPGRAPAAHHPRVAGSPGGTRTSPAALIGTTGASTSRAGIEIVARRSGTPLGRRAPRAAPTVPPTERSTRRPGEPAPARHRPRSRPTGRSRCRCRTGAGLRQHQPATGRGDLVRSRTAYVVGRGTPHGEPVAAGESLEVVECSAAGVHGVPGQQGAPPAVAGPGAVGPPAQGAGVRGRHQRAARGPDGYDGRVDPQVRDRDPARRARRTSGRGGGRCVRRHLRCGGRTSAGGRPARRHGSPGAPSRANQEPVPTRTSTTAGHGQQAGEATRRGRPAHRRRSTVAASDDVPPGPPGQAAAEGDQDQRRRRPGRAGLVRTARRRRRSARAGAVSGRRPRARRYQRREGRAGGQRRRCRRRLRGARVGRLRRARPPAGAPRAGSRRGGCSVRRRLAGRVSPGGCSSGGVSPAAHGWTQNTLVLVSLPSDRGVRR